MHSNRIAVVVGFALSLVSSIALARQGRPYYFDKVADTSGPFAFFFRPELSDNGRVVFKAWEDGQSGEGLFTGPNPATDAFFRVPHPQFETLRGYSINDVGSITFTSQFGGTQTTASKASAFDGPSLANNLIDKMPRSLYGIGSVVHNTSGQTIVKATWKDSTIAVRDIVVGAGADGVGKELARATNSTGTYKSFGQVALNNNGVAVYSIERWSGHPGSEIEYVPVTGGDPTQVEWTNVSADSAAWFGINDSNEIAFNANRIVGQQIITAIARGTLAGGEAQIVADDTGAFNYFVDVGINNAGTVAFHAGLDNDGGKAIFVGGDPVNDRVVGMGDQLFGGTLQDTYFTRDGLNNLGQIAFGYSLRNAQGSGVAIATPATPGDADGNRIINFDDYARIDNGFNNGLTGWTNGDFNENGVINFDDYALIDNNYNLQFGNGGRAGTRGVPEPGGCVILLSSLIPLSRNRRRR